MTSVHRLLHLGEQILLKSVWLCLSFPSPAFSFDRLITPIMCVEGFGLVRTTQHAYEEHTRK
jgi:hypothetical protein